jgi:hypothetical protein
MNSSRYKRVLAHSQTMKNGSPTITAARDALDGLQVINWSAQAE